MRTISLASSLGDNWCKWTLSLPTIGTDVIQKFEKKKLSNVVFVLWFILTARPIP